MALEKTKREQLVEIMWNQKIDILFLQETWINTANPETCGGYMFLFSTIIDNKLREAEAKRRRENKPKGKGNAKATLRTNILRRLVLE